MDDERRTGEVEVDIGLDEVTRTRARTRFVARKRAPEPPKDPEVGDPWCPLTVRARLMRFGRVWRKVPHTPDTRPEPVRSQMPETVKEIFKDQKGEPMRLPVASVDMTAALQLLDAYIAYRDDPDRKELWWAIADKETDRKMAERYSCHHATIARRKQAFLVEVAADWNARGWVVMLGDVVQAKKLIHRNIK